MTQTTVRTTHRALYIITVPHQPQLIMTSHIRVDHKRKTPVNTSPKELFTLSRFSVKDYSGTVEQEIINDVSVAEDFSESIYLPIQLANFPTIINGLCDSGSELTVLAKGVIPQQLLQRVRRVKLRGIFGDSVDADLVILK